SPGPSSPAPAGAAQGGPQPPAGLGSDPMGGDQETVIRGGPGVPPPPGYQPPAGGYQYPGGYQPPVGPGVPPGPPPSTPRKRPGGAILVAGGLAIVVVLYLIIGAVASLPPFGGPSPTTLFIPPVTTLPPTPTTGVPCTNSSFNCPLANLLTGGTSIDHLDPTADCQSFTASTTGFVGATFALECTTVPGESGWTLFAYQFNSAANFQTSFTAYNAAKNFDPGTAGSNCPPTAGDGEGSYVWNSPTFPGASGQVLECFSTGVSGGATNQPTYIWTLPSQGALFELVASASASFSALDAWWKMNSPPYPQS
ncbi:MAG: hypothetical protein ACRDYC_10210, partial [Acidimicrobiales bacterium]